MKLKKKNWIHPFHIYHCEVLPECPYCEQLIAPIKGKNNIYEIPTWECSSCKRKFTLVLKELDD